MEGVLRRLGESQYKAQTDREIKCVYSPIDFTLHQLVEHFIIPEVPDVVRVNPEGYQRNLALLQEIESLCP